MPYLENKHSPHYHYIRSKLFAKNGGRKDKQKRWHTENLKRTYRELKNAEVIMKDEVDDYKYENFQSIAEVLKRKTAR